MQNTAKEIMADDILVYGRRKTTEEAMRDHKENLENLFIKLRQVNLKLNKDKVRICQGQILWTHINRKYSQIQKRYPQFGTWNFAAPRTKKVY